MNVSVVANGEGCRLEATDSGAPAAARSNRKGYDNPADKTSNRRLIMSVRYSLSLVELFRATPAKTSLLAFGPLVLALGQLGNGYANSISPAVSIGFAVVMVAFAVIATRHHAAEHRLRRLEGEVDADLESAFDSTR